MILTAYNSNLNLMADISCMSIGSNMGQKKINVATVKEEGKEDEDEKEGLWDGRR